MTTFASLGKSRRFVLIIFMLASCMLTEVLPADILISAIFGEGSHFLAAASVGESLVQRGHKVTFLISNAYDHRVADPRYSNFSFEVFQHPVPVEEVRQLFYSANTIALNAEAKTTQFFQLVQLMSQRMADDCEAVLTNETLVERLARNDVILFDISWSCARYMKAVFEKRDESPQRRTMITLSPTSPWMGFLQTIGSSVNYAYQPEMNTGFSNKMCFYERLLNVLQSHLIFIMGDRTALPSFQRLGETLGLDPRIHPIHDMVEFDLHLLNIDFTSDFAMPLPPNVITVGGLTVIPAKRLREDLETFVQSSGEHGVVVFTLGTYLASITIIRPELAVMFAEAFRRLPQKVLWQLKELPDWELPPNVKTMPWLPQNDLLGHAKTRAFMFQGGNNGFQEACYHGVPAVVIPLQGDQYDVAARIVSRGMGRKIDKQDLSADIIHEALTEVINNPSYNAVAKRISAMYKDKPMSSRDRAAFWIEHVIKFGGSYMQSPARDLNFIQYHLLDVMAFLAAVVIVVVVILIYILRCCLSLCCRMIGRVKSKID